MVKRIKHRASNLFFEKENLMASSGNVQFRGGLRVLVQAFSNALLPQTVTIQPPAGPAAVFTGSGEGNIPMKLVTPGFLTPGALGGGWPSFAVPGAASQLSLYKVTTTHGASLPSKIEIDQAIYSNPDGGSIIMGTVASEDSGDNDYNDSFTIFVTWTAP
jgi:hypothetical protein